MKGALARLDELAIEHRLHETSPHFATRFHQTVHALLVTYEAEASLSSDTIGPFVEPGTTDQDDVVTEFAQRDDTKKPLPRRLGRSSPPNASPASIVNPVVSEKHLTVRNQELGSCSLVVC
jgi:hypothetical protein